MDRESREIKVARSMAWERAKGELRSMLPTYWDNDAAYQEFKAHTESYINYIEGEGVQE